MISWISNYELFWHDEVVLKLETQKQQAVKLKRKNTKLLPSHDDDENSVENEMTK